MLELFVVRGFAKTYVTRPTNYIAGLWQLFSLLVNIHFINTIYFSDVMWHHISVETKSNQVEFPTPSLCLIWLEIKEKVGRCYEKEREDKTWRNWERVAGYVFPKTSKMSLFITNCRVDVIFCSNNVTLKSTPLCRNKCV